MNADDLTQDRTVRDDRAVPIPEATLPILPPPDATLPTTPGTVADAGDYGLRPVPRPASAGPYEAGQILFERYLLLRVLGRGGMGVVWLARDQKLSREVALKFLPDAVQLDAVALEDLKRETRRCLELTHPHIVRIHDFLEGERGAGISMEFIDGQTLSTLRLARPNRIFDFAEVEAWTLHICQALDYAHHDARVVHRDIKPSNLMLTTRGQVKIADFGIARSLSDSMSRVSSGAGNSSGTLLYMSPEQMRGEDPDPGDDLYALGATLFELLSGKPPFHSGSIYDQVQNVPSPRLADRRAKVAPGLPPVPPRWEAALGRCMAKRRQDRFSRPLELAEALGLVPSGSVPKAAADWNEAPTLTSVTLPSPPPPLVPAVPRPPSGPWWKSRAALVGGGAALALAAVAAAGIVLQPFFAKPGELGVESNPPGAQVVLDGRDASGQPTPAHFDKVRPGSHDLRLVLPGYAPFTATVQVVSGSLLHLDPYVLVRQRGDVSLESLPAGLTYTLHGRTSEKSTASGTTPGLAPALPTGVYDVDFDSRGASHRVTVRVEADSTAHVVFDVVWEDAMKGLPDGLRAKLAQPSPALEAGEKDPAAAALRTAFQGYLAAGEIPPASDTVAKLKAIGADATAQEKALADARAGWEKKLSAEADADVSAGNDYAAERVLERLSQGGSAPVRTQLQAKYQSPLAEYDARVAGLSGQVAAARRDGQTESVYRDLSALAQKNPGDYRLGLATVSLELDLPSELDRVRNRCRQLDAFGASHAEAASDAEFKSDVEIYRRNLKLHTAFQGQLDGLRQKKSQAASRSQSLQARLKQEQDKKNGYDIAKSIGLGLFGGGLVGGSGEAAGVGGLVGGIGAKGSSDKQALISGLKQQISQADADASTASQQFDAKQAEYTAFCRKSIREDGVGA